MSFLAKRPLDPSFSIATKKSLPVPGFASTKRDPFESKLPSPLDRKRDVNAILAELVGGVLSRSELAALKQEPVLSHKGGSTPESAPVLPAPSLTADDIGNLAREAQEAERLKDLAEQSPDEYERRQRAEAEAKRRLPRSKVSAAAAEAAKATSASVGAPPSQRRQPNRLSADRFFQHVMRNDIARESESLMRSRVHAKWEHAQMADASRQECTGAKRVRAVREALGVLNKNGWKWSKQQQIMTEAWILQSLPSYYGDELNAHLFELLRKAGVSEIHTESAAMMQRRGGKTTMVSGFAASEIATQPSHDVLTYSNNLRAAKAVLLNTYKMLKVLAANLGGSIKSLNKNESLTFVTRDGFENEMKCFPAKPENLRGTGSTKKSGTVIAEEFGFMDVRVVFQIIGPTLTRKNVKFIGITTVNPDDSFVTPLTEAKFPDGRSVFLVLNFELVCAECKKAGRALQCRCLMGDIPEWQSGDQIDKLSLIMGASTFLTEIKGMAIDETVTPAFHQVSVEWLRSQESVMQSGDLYSREIFIAIDPAAGGKHSRFAMVAGIFIGREMVVSKSWEWWRGGGGGGVGVRSGRISSLFIVIVWNWVIGFNQ